jgi:hypothetical protein
MNEAIKSFLEYVDSDQPIDLPVALSALAPLLEAGQQEELISDSDWLLIPADKRGMILSAFGVVSVIGIASNW